MTTELWLFVSKFPLSFLVAKDDCLIGVLLHGQTHFSSSTQFAGTEILAQSNPCITTLFWDLDLNFNFCKVQ
jgi:hypothetical protein